MAICCLKATLPRHRINHGVEIWQHCMADASYLQPRPWWPSLSWKEFFFEIYLAINKFHKLDRSSIKNGYFLEHIKATLKKQSFKFHLQSGSKNQHGGSSSFVTLWLRLFRHFIFLVLILVIIVSFYPITAQKGILKDHEGIDLKLFVVFAISWVRNDAICHAKFYDPTLIRP